MNLSAITLQQLVKELAPHVTRRLIRDAFLTRSNVLYLNLGDIGHLCCSAHPNRSYLQRSEPTDPPQEKQPTWVTHHLTQSGIVSVSHIPNERIIHFTLSRQDRLGKENQYTLICELIGRQANLILVDANTQKILGATRHTRAKADHIREVLPGRIYQSPNPQYGKTFRDLDPTALAQAFEENPTSPSQALQHAILGLDHLTAQELCHRLRCTGPLPAEAYPKLIHQIQAFLTSPPFVEGAVALSNDRNQLSLSPLQVTYTSPNETFDTLNAGITHLLAQETVHSSLKGQITNLEKDLNGKRINNQRKLERMADDLADAGRADEYERLGNLLLANLQHITAGAETITLTDIQSDQQIEVQIPLNPKRSPVDNANEYIKRSKKGRKGAPILQKRIDETHLQNKEIDHYLDRLPKIPDENSFGQLRTELEAHKLVKAPKPKQQKNQNRKRAPGEIHPRRYRTRDGWLVLVGRNNQENDKLTKGSAREDIFFHVHGCPGSHVILKQEGRAEKPPKNTMKEAASLAAYWSKARNSKLAPVSYTEIRYVNKPKGAPAGLVTIKNEKSIMVQPHEIRKEDET
ncbi:MAG: fibronectin-binding domain-containing protein [Candidatus Latescibacteria bacterium]|jgi:predicted ribosome quality control (RQC) complex YloA/Tae2 family protein|nr:fibronectin-binding domain-containing protein [Candidatus Latescibacterota bacterium]MBT4140971.1 fibronectin-binding domain-containing protein [Candidatus Latescibacterota bacterium]MBT5829628.1 fibronectin-binding domain-containing protein [Candidatus Latescibacterota bacterium]